VLYCLKLNQDPFLGKWSFTVLLRRSWANEIAGSLTGETVATVGKTLRGSYDRGSGNSALHSISVRVCGLRSSFGLKFVEDKSNEIQAVQELVELQDLAGAVLTTGGMHYQTHTAKAIVAKHADYIMVVKGNQPIRQRRCKSRN
jgi:hypothetical protein